MSEKQCDWLGEKTGILVLAVTGRIGSGTSFVANALVSELKTYDYKPKLIKITKEFLNPENLLETFAGRTKELQSRGNQLRENCGNDILGVKVIQYIAEDLTSHKAFEKGSDNRLAYVIDSLKNPEEIDILKAVFKDAFWVVGVVAHDSTRKKRLQEQKRISDEDFDRISERDANEGIKHGQNVIKTIIKSEYFFENNYDKETKIQFECQRFLNLLFQGTIETPRQDEYGMHLAFMAADKSACLSRQVGAAIISHDGSVIATGCNDVPQFGGGLYTSESPSDNRCFARSQMCHNDDEKRIIAEEIVDALKKKFQDNNELTERANHIKNILLEDTRIKQLIEFSRAVHAEMDAIISVACSGKSGIVGSTMYVTTYPCHNCAKHIIDAGIKRVVFVEPYEKSLAQKLHADAINNPLEEKCSNKISFDNYGGVSPERYSDFFSMKSERKSKSRLIRCSKINLLPLGLQESEALKSRLARFLDNYQFNSACTNAFDKIK